MPAFRFVHAADLHLDAAFAGVSRDLSPRFADSLHRATFTAWDRLVELCLAELPHALILAGDVHNHEDGSLRAQLALRNGCERLVAAGVRVFIAHGNHDPLSSRMRSLRWPDGVVVFGPQVEAWPVTQDGRMLAVVQGVSHETDRETRNLARRFSRTGSAQGEPVPPNVPQVGVLHCNVGSTPGSLDTARYAPCSQEDLAASGLDYWALGHIHLPQVLRTRPHVVYPGSTQGLHINEEGPRGCQLVTLHADGGVDMEFRPLAPVLWRTLDVSIDGAGQTGVVPGQTNVAPDRPDIAENGPDPARQEQDREGVASLEALHDRILQAVERCLSEADPATEAVLFRVRLHGRGPLDRQLRRTGATEELLEMLREAGGSLAPLAWVKDMELHTLPDADMDALRRRDDLLGEVLRVADAARGLPETPPGAAPAGDAACPASAESRDGQPVPANPLATLANPTDGHAQADPEALRALATAVLGPLFDSPRGRRFLGPSDAIPPEELAALLEDAERICRDMLETD